MRTILVLAVVLGVGSGTVFGADVAGEQKLPFTVSVETTGIVRPLKPDGTVDYVRALNEKMNVGVTPENNGFVKWLEVVGTSDIVLGAKVKGRILEMCGAKEMAGVTFETYEEYLKKQGMGQTQIDQHGNDVLTASRRIWKRTDYPELAEYLDSIEPKMALAKEAAGREKWWMPYVGETTFAVLLPSLGSVRVMGQYLCARGTLRAGAGDFEGFLADATAARQLARHEAQGRTLIEMLVAVAMENLACESEGAVVAAGNLPVAEIGLMQKADGELPPLPRAWHGVDEMERWGLTEFATELAMGKAAEMEKMLQEPDFFSGLETSEVDWDVVLKRLNVLENEVVAPMKIENGREAREANKEEEKQIENLKRDAGGIGIAKRDGETKGDYSLRVANFIAAVLMPSVGRADELERRSEMERAMLQAVFAAGRFKADKGNWPDKLDDLVPLYLGKVGVDDYDQDGGELKYVVTDTGICVYSVGQNGRDDGGVKDPKIKADDIAVGVVEAPVAPPPPLP